MVNPKQYTGGPHRQMRAVLFSGGWGRNHAILLPDMRVNPEQERRRLADFYGGLSDGELWKLEEDSDSLTELAREALEDEMDRRELDEVPRDNRIRKPQAEQLEFRDLVTVRKFRNLPEALLAKGSLESVGIDCFLFDHNLVRLFVSHFVGGIRLQVKAEDAALALEVLNQPMLEGLYVEGIGLYEQPRCPRCSSLEVSMQPVNPSFTLLPEENLCECRFCRHRWREREGLSSAEQKPPKS